MTARKKVSAGKRIRDAQKRARDAVEEGFSDLERRLPSNLRSAVRDMRANLRVLQRLEKALAPSAQRASGGSAPPRRKKR